MSLLPTALDYLAKNWPVIPCRLWFKNPGDTRAEKIPLVRWKPYQDALPTPQELTKWFTQWPTAQLGLVTGPGVGLMVVDIDLGATDADIASLQLPTTLISKTPSGGRHVFLRYPKNKKVKTVAGFRPHIDIRGDGGFVVIPPSKYPNGVPYEWLIDPEYADIAEAPEHLLSLISDDTTSTQRTDYKAIAFGAPQGQRNHSAAVMAGCLLLNLHPSLWNDVAWPLLRAWNKQNSPPLEDFELLLVFNSIARSEWCRQERIYTTQTNDL